MLSVCCFLFSSLKEPHLIVANLTPDSVTAGILDTETLEGHLQKQLGRGLGLWGVGTQSYASIQLAFISSQLQLKDPNCWAGEEVGRLLFPTPHAC